MKFTKDQQQTIFNMWSEDYPLKEIAARLSEEGAKTETGLPISNQVISIFCLENGMRRQKYKKPAFDKAKRKKEKQMLKHALLKNEPKQLRLTVTKPPVEKTSSANAQIVLAVISSKEFSQEMKLNIIKQILV